MNPFDEPFDDFLYGIVCLPECASDISKMLMPLSKANLNIASAWSSDTPDENIGHVPRPTFEILRPLLPRFLYRKPGVGVVPGRMVNAGFEPRLIEWPMFLKILVRTWTIF